MTVNLAHPYRTLDQSPAIAVLVLDRDRNHDLRLELLGRGASSMKASVTL